jgi:hypothetical protein
MTTFLLHMYWIDILWVLIFIWIMLFFIAKNAHKICERNKKYNQELYAMRAEIYTEYEKNFFL